MSFQYSLIIPLLLICIAFYYLEKATKRVDVLKVTKNIIKIPNINTEVKRKNQIENKENKADKSNKANKEIGNINELINITEVDDKYSSVTNSDYPLNSQSFVETLHNIPESNGNVDVSLTPDKQKLTPQGYEEKEHFTYYFGKQFDHLYH